MRGKVFATVLLGMTMSGCVSTLDSSPATPAAKGMRYALPVPLLKVTPGSDGTMALEVLYLPDPKNTYTVQASSFLGAYTLDVKVKEGLLESVSFNSNSTVVADQLLTTAAAVKKAQIDADQKAEDASIKKAEEAAKVAQASAKALADARLSVDVAQAKLDWLTNHGGTKEQILAAELVLTEAQTRLEPLKTAAALDLSSANALSGGDDPKAAGPIFFRLAPGEGGRVDLIADTPQIMESTSFAAKPPKPVKPVAYEIVPPVVVRPTANGLVLKVKVSQAIKAVLTDDIEFESLSAPGTTVTSPRIDISTADSVTYLIVTFADQMPVGRYRLDIPVEDAKGARALPEALTVDIGPKLPG